MERPCVCVFFFFFSFFTLKHPVSVPKRNNRFTSKAHANAFDLIVGVTNTDILLLRTLFYSSQEQWIECLTSHTHVIQKAIRQCLGEQRTGK